MSYELLKQLDPGKGNIKLFYGETNGVAKVTAASISKYSSNNPEEYIANSLASATSITLPFVDNGYVFSITNTQEYLTHFYIDVQEIPITATGSVFNTETNIIPFLASTKYYTAYFNPTDYDLTLNNVTGSRPSLTHRQVERTVSKALPSNIEALLGITSTALAAVKFQSNSSPTISLKATDLYYGINLPSYSDVQVVTITEESTIKLIKSELGKVAQALRTGVHSFEGTSLTIENDVYLEISTDDTFSNPILVKHIVSQVATGYYDKLTVKSKQMPFRDQIPAGTYYLRFRQLHHFVSYDSVSKVSLNTFTYNNVRKRNDIFIKVGFESKSQLIPYADFAEIPESFYTSTGLKNGRFAGSKTSANTYKGVPSAIAGKTIAGEIYSDVADSNFILSQSYSDRVLQTILFEGNHKKNSPQLNPTYLGTLQTSLPDIIGTVNDLSSTFVQVNLESKLKISPYDVLKIGNEFLQIQPADYLPLGSEVEYPRTIEGASGESSEVENPATFNVARGHADSFTGLTSSLHQVGSAVILIQGDHIYQLERNRPKKAIESKIWLDGVNQLITTDNQGRVIYASNGTLAGSGVTPTPTATISVTPSISITPSPTPSVSLSVGASVTPTPTISTSVIPATPSVTPSISITPSGSPTITYQVTGTTSKYLTADANNDYRQEQFTGTITVTGTSVSIRAKAYVQTGYIGESKVEIPTTGQSSTASKQGFGTAYGSYFTLAPGTYTYNFTATVDAGPGTLTVATLSFGQN